jgi:hypothetical protein
LLHTGEAGNGHGANRHEEEGMNGNRIGGRKEGGEFLNGFNENIWN